jgi:hypothetical protein
MSNQASRGNPEFITNRQPFLDQLDGLIESSKRFMPFFVTAAVDARGFLQDEGIRQEYQKTVADLQKQAGDALVKVQQEATRAIDDAKKLADQIEQKARRTAARVSVEEAQQQFMEAQAAFEKKVKLWGWLSGGSIVLFVGTVATFILIAIPDNQYQAIYHTGLRIAVLSAEALLAGMCFKVLRAYLNMRERNLHRQRVANSIESCVVSAQTPEVRDFILALLVENMAGFGTSGLLAHDSEAIGTPRLSPDAVLRAFASSSSSKGT